MYFSVKKRIGPGLLQFQLQWLNRGLSGATLTCLQLLCLQFGRYMALYRNNQGNDGWSNVEVRIFRIAAGTCVRIYMIYDLYMHL